MCKGDVSLVTFSWVDNDRAPKPNFEVEHECVNWEKVDNWAKEHRFDIFDETTLVHPKLGTLYCIKFITLSNRMHYCRSVFPRERIQRNR